jgi:hypothetical protein
MVRRQANARAAAEAALAALDDRLAQLGAARAAQRRARAAPRALEVHRLAD